MLFILQQYKDTDFGADECYLPAVFVDFVHIFGLLLSGIIPCENIKLGTARAY